LIAKKVLGNIGEIKSCEYLQSAGYLIIEKNFRCIYGEIDIVASRGNVICFVEVKTRSNSSYGEPLESVNPQKTGRIKNIASYYLGLKHLNTFEVSFDVITIKVSGKKLLMQHFKNCF
jgi:putative endonuclease